jgi:hypothetical protein
MDQNLVTWLSSYRGTRKWSYADEHIVSPHKSALEEEEVGCYSEADGSH